MAAFFQSDAHFRIFTSALEAAIELFDDDPDENLLERQKFQMESLIGLEDQFRAKLIKHRWYEDVYNAFITKVDGAKALGNNGNVLTSRPYFRERQEVCIGPICKAIKARNLDELSKFHFNYQFIALAIKSMPWTENHELRKLEKKISKLRNKIVVSNMPLAISQARQFWSKTVSKDPSGQLSYMDLIQISSEGLMSAVDKYCLPFTRNFRAVIIGRAVGNFIDCNNQTFLHFFPKDKRKLYRGNKKIWKYTGAVDFEEVARFINEVIEIPSHRTNAIEIQALFAAASVVSTEMLVAPGDNSDSESHGAINRMDTVADEPIHQPDVIHEEAEAITTMKAAISQLSNFEQKLLRLKGVSLGAI